MKQNSGKKQSFRSVESGEDLRWYLWIVQQQELFGCVFFENFDKAQRNAAGCLVGDILSYVYNFNSLKTVWKSEQNALEKIKRNSLLSFIGRCNKYNLRVSSTILELAL